MAVGEHAEFSDGYDDDYEEYFEIEPDFEDLTDYVDEITDADLEDVLLQKPKLNENFDNIIVVDNIPSVEEKKFGKLRTVLVKIFSPCGEIVNISFPKDSEGKTKSYCFLEFSKLEEASTAVQKFNGYKLDKTHIFFVFLFEDFNKYKDVPDVWTSSSHDDFSWPSDLHNWLLDPDGLDQYAISYENGEKTAVVLNTPDNPTFVMERRGFTESQFRWSPKGTYLSTIHAQGVALWGGVEFNRIRRFSHRHVVFVDFSPCERFLVSYSQTGVGDNSPIIMWDVLTGYKKRGFSCETTSQWSMFFWSYSGEYFARRGEETLSIYDSQTFSLLDKRSLKIPGLKTFQWSPKQNVVAYWVGEGENAPARVVIISVPERVEICVKNLFIVADLTLCWQESGDFLAAKVDRYKAKKKEDGTVKYQGIYHNLELFRMRERLVPVDLLELKDTIVAFAWEPTGNRFCLLREGQRGVASPDFYRMVLQHKVEFIKSIDKCTGSSMFWCPTGQFVLFADLKSVNCGSLQFVDANDMSIMASVEHPMASEIHWDPSGRYVVSMVPAYKNKDDCSYWIWSFQGRLLEKVKTQVPSFCQLLWRPRPSSLLTKEHLKEVRKNMKKFSSQFELKDRTRRNKASKEILEKRKVMMEDFRKWREGVAPIVAENQEERTRQRGRDAEYEDTDEMIQERVEFLLDVTETVIEE